MRQVDQHKGIERKGRDKKIGKGKCEERRVCFKVERTRAAIRVRGEVREGYER